MNHLEEARRYLAVIEDGYARAKASQWRESAPSWEEQARLRGMADSHALLAIAEALKAQR